MKETRTLLDDVYVDEISDNTSNESMNWITLSAKMPYYGSDSLICIVSFLKKQLSRCEFIDAFKEPEITSSVLNKRLTISFTAEHMTLSDFCDLIHLIYIPTINITNEANHVIVCYYNAYTTAHSIHDITIGVQSLSEFIPFFNHFFPDATENEIYSAFIRSYARIHDTDIITDRNKRYVLYVATKKAIAADKNGNFITDTWFHDIRCFKEGFAAVQRTDLRWNFINTCGELLSPDRWFLRVEDFENGLALVTDEITGDDNFIKPDGSILLSKWQHFLSPFSEGYACVTNENNLQNFIDMQGNILFKEWRNYEYGPFVNGFSVVSTQSGMQNLIDKTGKLVSETWFYECNNFTKEGFAAVATDKFSYNFIDKNGNLLSKVSFDACRDFCEGYAAVNDAGKWNFIDTKGKKIFKTFEFINCKDFCEGFAIIETLKHTYLFVNSKEKFLSLTRNPIHGFAMCEPFKNGIAKVYDNDKQFNFINKKGKLIFKNWINRYEDVIVAEDMFIFKNSGMCVDFKGNLLSTI